MNRYCIYFASYTLAIDFNANQSGIEQSQVAHAPISDNPAILNARGSTTEFPCRTSTTYIAIEVCCAIMSFESENLVDHGKLFVKQSKGISGTEKAKSWLRSYPTSSPPPDEVAATATTARRTTNKQPHYPLSMNLRMRTNEGMVTRSKCPAACPDSKAKCSGTTTPPTDARITRAQCKRSMQSDQSTTTKGTSGVTKPNQRKSRASTETTSRSPSPRPPRGGRCRYTKKPHRTSKW